VLPNEKCPRWHIHRSDSVVQENRLAQNGLGTPVASGVHVAGDRNRVAGNSTTANDKGILVSGRGNLVDGNHVRGNSGPGIEVTTANAKNVIIRNEAGDNGGSYTSIAGNNAAPIVAPESAANPFSNIVKIERKL
jgi:parallel beta-helix repeat protein